MAKENEVGIITEQGAWGLGFNPLTEDEKETLKNNKDTEEKKDSSK